MWLRWIGPHDLLVDGEVYVASQPVCFEQVRTVIESVQTRRVPVRAHIDISHVRISQVCLIGVLRIIWELHEATAGDPWLQSVSLIGASRRAQSLWRYLSTLFPEDLRLFSSPNTNEDLACGVPSPACPPVVPVEAHRARVPRERRAVPVCPAPRPEPHDA